MAFLHIGLIAMAIILLQSIGNEPVHAAGSDGYARSDYVLPPGIRKEGISFAGSSIPLNRREVRQRIHDQLNVLLMDRRSKLMEWFDRLAESGPTIKKVLTDENVPPDLIYVAVLMGELLPNTKNALRRGRMVGARWLRKSKSARMACRG